tara:strand:- start:184 stop:1434 length:1251 start_codon:yes stop_codon:yes gene_type:complete
VFSSYERLLIKRFLFSKKSDGYISIFSWFSIIGITVGVAAIIIVMSVMNGFREELTKRILGINGHINIYSKSGEIIQNDILKINKIELNSSKILPLLETQALLISDESSKGILLKGYDPLINNEKIFIKNNIIEGRIYSNNSDEVIIGNVLANRLKLSLGDKIKIAIPKTDKTIFGEIPRFKTLYIVGIFNLGMYEYDLNFVFTNPRIPRKLLMFESDSYNKIEIFTSDPQNIEVVQQQLNLKIDKINDLLYSISWKEVNNSLLNALQVEKNVMFLILTLIIIVASMNIISGLIIFVKEKNKDIGILKTIGLSKKSLIKVFLSIGLLIGLIGTFFGTFFGIIFSINISKIQNFLENLLNVNLFSNEIYYLSSLPSQLDKFEVFYVVIISLVISLIATLFPAYRSSLIDPIKSLKND